MSWKKNLKILLVCLIFNFGFCIRYDWELNQLNQIQDFFQTYSNQKFNSTDEVIKDARLVINKWMNEKTVNSGGIPGAVFGFSIKGKTIWTEGFGRTDIENNVTTDKNSVWRLASISKPLTTALVAQLIDRKLLELNKSIHDYLPTSLFPNKTFGGKKVDITLKQLLSHMAGLHLTELDDFNSVYLAKNVSQSLNRFKNEEVLFKPGTKFSYSNYGFQVVGAIIESVVNNTYQNEIKRFYSQLKMNKTYAETRSQIFEHRPRYYEPINVSVAPDDNHLTNADLLDDLFSYEGWWPSGGMVSTVDDLLTFGNAMITAYKGGNKSSYAIWDNDLNEINSHSISSIGFLSQSIVKELWTPETKGIHKDQDFGKNEYGLSNYCLIIIKI